MKLTKNKKQQIEELYPDPDDREMIFECIEDDDIDSLPHYMYLKVAKILNIMI